MKIKTMMKYHSVPTIMVKFFKKLVILSAVKDVEHWKTHSFLVEIHNVHPLWKNMWQFLIK